MKDSVIDGYVDLLVKNYAGDDKYSFNVGSLKNNNEKKYYRDHDYFYIIDEEKNVKLYDIKSGEYLGKCKANIYSLYNNCILYLNDNAKVEYIDKLIQKAT